MVLNSTNRLHNNNSKVVGIQNKINNRNQQQSILQFTPRRESPPIRYQGVLDNTKRIENIRILSINPNGFNVDNYEKIN